MRTVTIVRVDSEIEKLQLGWWNDEKEEFTPIEGPTDFEEAATILGCSEKMLESLDMLVDYLKELIGKDLRDIWERLDTLERR